MATNDAAVSPAKGAGPGGGETMNEFSAVNGTIQFATFFLGGQLFGVDVLRVQEVLRYQDKSDIPLSPSYVSGLINLRGQIVTLLDLRTRLGLPPFEEGKRPMNVVVNSSEGPLSLMVDEIGDVLDVSRDVFEGPPPTMTGDMAEYVQGVCKLEDRILIILDVNRLMESSEG